MAPRMDNYREPDRPQRVDLPGPEVHFSCISKATFCRSLPTFYETLSTFCRSSPLFYQILSTFCRTLPTFCPKFSKLSRTLPNFFCRKMMKTTTSTKKKITRFRAQWKSVHYGADSTERRESSTILRESSHNCILKIAAITMRNRF